MAKKKVTRKELLKSPDEFLTLSARAAIFITQHTQQLKYIGIAIAAIAVVYLATNEVIKYINNKGQEGYNKAYYASKESMKPDATPEDIKKIGDLFEEVHKEYSFSKAAKLALPQAGYAKFLTGEYDDAIKTYKGFLEEVPENSQYRFLTSIAIAACYEAKEELKSAISTLEPLMVSAENPFKENAMFNLARLYRLDSQFDKEKKLLKEFVETYESSPFLPVVKARL